MRWVSAWPRRCLRRRSSRCAAWCMPAACAARACPRPTSRRTATRTPSAPRASRFARSRSFRRFEESHALLRRDRPAEEVALHLVALVRLEEVALGGVLDALADHLQVQRMAERDDGPRQDAAVWPAVRGDVAHERAVDLERSEERRVGKECRSRWSRYQ